MRTGQLWEGSPQFSSQWLVCHICSASCRAPFRRASVKSAVNLENLPQRSRMCVHTHTHTQTQHSSTETASGGDSVCRNPDSTASPGTRHHVARQSVTCQARFYSSAELTPSLTLKEGPQSGLRRGSPRGGAPPVLSLAISWPGPQKALMSRRRHEEQPRGGYQRCPRGGLKGTSLSPAAGRCHCI